MFHSVQHTSLALHLLNLFLSIFLFMMLLWMAICSCFIFTTLAVNCLNFFFLEMTSFWDQAESEHQEGFTLCPPAWLWKTQVSQSPDTSWLQLRVQLALEAPGKWQACPVGQEHVERWGPQEVDCTGVAFTGFLGCKCGAQAQGWNQEQG